MNPQKMHPIVLSTADTSPDKYKKEGNLKYFRITKVNKNSNYKKFVFLFTIPT